MMMILLMRMSVDTSGVLPFAIIELVMLLLLLRFSQSTISRCAATISVDIDYIADPTTSRVTFLLLQM